MVTPFTSFTRLSCYVPICRSRHTCTLHIDEENFFFIIVCQDVLRMRSSLWVGFIMHFYRPHAESSGLRRACSLDGVIDERVATQHDL